MMKKYCYRFIYGGGLGECGGFGGGCDWLCLGSRKGGDSS